MENLINKYVWVNVLHIKDDYFQKFIYPNDLKIIQQSHLTNHAFKCIGVFENDYFTLDSYEITLRLRKEAFTLMTKQPTFEPLENVKFFSSKGVLTFGTIKSIFWHSNEQKHIYKLEVNGKMKTRRYFEEDLAKVAEN